MSEDVQNVQYNQSVIESVLTRAIPPDPGAAGVNWVHRRVQLTLKVAGWMVIRTTGDENSELSASHELGKPVVVTALVRKIPDFLSALTTSTYVQRASMV